MPNWRTIHQTAGDTERFHVGLWYGMGDRPHVYCKQLVGKEKMIYTEIVGVRVQVESTHPITGAVQRRWACIHYSPLWRRRTRWWCQSRTVRRS